MVAPPLTLAYLADYPAHVPQVARWLHDQFGYLSPNSTLEKRLARLRANLNRAAVPTVLVALLGDEPVGTASLVAEDMTIRPQLTPWLASVYVTPAHRQRGVGRALVRRVVDEAAALGHTRLWLYTSDDRIRFYQAMGWAITEQVDYRGARMTIMALDLSSA